jgi:hypothetical protein
MIACEADDEDIATQRLVSKMWSSVTANRFAALFHQTVHEFTQAGMNDLLKVCQTSRYAREVRSVIIVTDCKRRRPAKFHITYDEALRALAVHGKPVSLGIRWRPSPGGEIVTPMQASGRLVSLLEKRVLPAARTAGIQDNDIVFELPDPVSVLPATNSYRRLVMWLFMMWHRHNTQGAPFNPRITIRFDMSTHGPLGTPTLSFDPHSDKFECHNLSARHLDPFYQFVHNRSYQELHLVNCTVPEYFFSGSNGSIQTLHMENVRICEGYWTASTDPTRQVQPGSARILLENLVVRLPNLTRLRLESIREGNFPWLRGGHHAVDITGTPEIARVLQHLLDG